MKTYTKTAIIALAVACIAPDVLANKQQTMVASEPENILAEKPQKKTFRQKMSGFEFGVGAPLVTPTGYNFFVGYANKNATSFWGKRFGIRADFTIPSALKLTGTMSDKTNGESGYVLDGRMKVLGFNINLNNNVEFDAFEADDGNPISIGQNAVDLSVALKNKNMGVLIDFYPFGNTWFFGGLRFSGGYYLGNLNLSVNANIKNDINYRYSVGNNGDFLNAQIVKGSRIGAEFDWNYHGPYAGFGFDLGIWRGFKFFMDAGVVFANTPHVSDKNIHDKDFVIQGCYEINGQPCSGEMVTIFQGAQKPDVDTVVHNAMGVAVRDTLNANTATYSSVIAQIPGFDGIEYSDLGDDIINYLNGDSTAPWINTLLTNNAGDDLEQTISDVKAEWQDNAADATDGIQKKIDQAWEDYEKEKNDAIKDANDFFKDYHMVPMVKLGFMYRF